MKKIPQKTAVFFYGLLLFFRQGVIIEKAVIWAAVGGETQKVFHFILIEVDEADIAVCFFIIYIVHAIIAS
jgi:hypothetical protein